MNRERFERAVVDLLYGELDETTTVAARRYMERSRYARELYAHLKVTRRLCFVPRHALPDEFEERVRGALAELAPARSRAERLGRYVSLLGSYAMRPGLATAVLLVLTLGSSLLFLRMRPDASASAHDGRGALEQAAPERLLLPGHDEARPQLVERSLPLALRPASADPRAPSASIAANAARGPLAPLSAAASQPEPPPREAPPREAPPPAIVQAETPPTGIPPRDTPPREPSPSEPSPSEAPPTAVAAGSPSSLAAAPVPAAVSAPAASRASASAPEGSHSALIAAAHAPPAHVPAASTTAEPTSVVAASTAPLPALGQPEAAQTDARSGAPEDEPAATFEAALAAYQGGEYARAQRYFERVSRGRDPRAAQAALYSAESARRAFGCAAAVGRFDAVRARFPGSKVLDEASFRAAKCLQELGDASAARERFEALLEVPAFTRDAKRALLEIDGIIEELPGERPLEIDVAPEAVLEGPDHAAMTEASNAAGGASP